MSQGRLRSWGGTFTMSLAFPVAALVAALLVFATSPFEAGLVIGVVAALVPWALVAGDVRVGPWVMVAAGVAIPGVLVAVYDAPGADFLALLAVAWLAAGGESLAAEVTAAVAASIVIPLVYALGDCAEVDGLNLLYVMPLMACARALAQTLAGNPTAVAYGAMPVTVKT